MNTDVEDSIFSMIDEKITKAGKLGQINESKKDECETFGKYHSLVCKSYFQPYYFLLV